jgi:diacylglycerol O-acyltransferase
MADDDVTEGAGPDDEHGVSSRAPREIRSERRMSDVEAMMWNVEKDPYLSSNVGNVTVLDCRPDVDRFRNRLLQAVERIPRLHQRVVPALGRMAPPEWQDDPDFDINFHLRHVSLPPPGTQRQLFDLAALIVADPFDRTRPLWEFSVVEGLEGGRAAVIQKMHHTIADGMGAIRMSEQFIDITRDAPDVGPTEISAEPSLPTNLFDVASETLAHGWRRTLGVGQRALVNSAGLVTDPSRLGSLAGEVVETGRSAVRQLTVSDRAHSELWSHRSLRRRLDSLDVSLDDARRTAKALGGSINDVFVTGAARGAGRYHREHGVEIGDLRMAMPVSTRHDASMGGNSFVPTRVVVPVWDDDPVRQFEIVHQRLDQTKHERAIGLVEPLAWLINVFPTSVLVRFARQQVEATDFTTSNLRAAPFDLFICGAMIEGNYPIGPLAGTAFNLTMMSYRDQMNMGLHIDAGAIPDGDVLRDAIIESFAEVLAAG